MYSQGESGGPSGEYTFWITAAVCTLPHTRGAAAEDTYCYGCCDARVGTGKMNILRVTCRGRPRTIQGDKKHYSSTPNTRELRKHVLRESCGTSYACPSKLVSTMLCSSILLRANEPPLVCQLFCPRLYLLLLRTTLPGS